MVWILWGVSTVLSIALLVSLVKTTQRLNETNESLKTANETNQQLLNMMNEPETLAKRFRLLMNDQGYPHVMIISGDVTVAEQRMDSNGCIVLTYGLDDETKIALALHGAHTAANEFGRCRIEAAFEDGPTLVIDPS